MLSLASVSAFFDLGLSNSLTQVCSHDFTALTWQPDRVEGSDADLSRLSSILRYSVVLMLVAAIFYFGAVGYHGVQTLSHSSENWLGAWLFLVGATGLRLVLSPLTNLLEGCGQYIKVQHFRLLDTILTSLLAWMLLLGSLGLYSPGSQILLGTVITCGLILWYYSGPLASIWTRAGSLAVGAGELGNLQWRHFVTGLCSLPVGLLAWTVSQKDGLVAGGQFGLSWTLAGMANVIILNYMSSYSPVMGQLAGVRRYCELLSLSRRLVWRGVAIAVVCWAGLLAGASLMQLYAPLWAVRFAPLEVLAVLGSGPLINSIYWGCLFEVRAQRQEPFVWIQIVSALVLTTWLCLVTPGRALIEVGVAQAVSSLLALPFAFWIVRRSRKQWE